MQHVVITSALTIAISLAIAAGVLSFVYSPFLSMFWRTIGGGV